MYLILTSKLTKTLAISTKSICKNHDISSRDPDALPASNYLVIQTPGDPYYANAGSSQINSPVSDQ